MPVFLPMSAEKIVNVAVVGAGAIGLAHIEGFQMHPRARVVALAETNTERAQTAARRHHVPVVVADYRELLARPDIDVVSIALPTYLHASAALEALAAGKHVMLDKPMATNAADGTKIVALAREKNLCFMVGQNQRFTPAAQAVKQLVTGGRLGEVYHAKAVWLRRSGIPRIGSWFTQKQFAGGGCTYDIGVHVLDLALHLMGEFEVAAVSGQTFAKYGPRGRGDGSWGKSEIHPDRPFDVDDFCVALVKLASGRTVQLEVSWAAAMEHADVNGVQLFGTEGGATTHPLRWCRETALGYETAQIAGSTALVPEERMVHFVDVVLGRAAPFVLPEQSLAVQRVLDAIYESARSGREVQLA
jgi:predicted dehydrogenase